MDAICFGQLVSSFPLGEPDMETNKVELSGGRVRRRWSCFNGFASSVVPSLDPV